MPTKESKMRTNNKARMAKKSAIASHANLKDTAIVKENTRIGVWKNGTDFEYEYAYCSVCGRMQWAGWCSHKEAKENVESFYADYRYCSGCGAKMKGGQYVK